MVGGFRSPILGENGVASRLRRAMVAGLMASNRYFLNAALGLVLFTGLSGCRAMREGRTVRASQDVPVSTPSAEQMEVGEIAFVRGEADPPFVLIELGSRVKLPDGASLQALATSSARQGGSASTGEGSDIALLKTTRQQSDGYQVANIVSGSPMRGDRVIMRYPKGDGTDPEDLQAFEDLPPLPGGRSRAKPGDRGQATPGEGRGGLLSGPVVRSSSTGDEPVYPPTAFGSPETREDVAPRAPSREMDPPPLPAWDALPDDGSDYIQNEGGR